MKRAAQIAVVVVGCLAGDSARAQSAATCSFDPGAAVVTVEVHGAPAVVERAGNEILLNGASCGGATTFTTDSIAVTGGAKVNVVTLVGKFAPGATVETDSAASEVEVTFDLGPGLDSVTLVYDDTSEVIEFGANGVDLEGDGDVDVFTAGVETVGVMAMGGDDTIDGLAYLGGLVLDGGDGADVIQGSPGADRLVGGAGVDDLSGRGGADRIEGGADGDLLRGGPGDDFLDGGAGDDDCLGDAGADLSYQGSAMDGADTFAGGLGKDTIYYSERTNGVSVSLDNVPTSGEAGEGDRIGVDVENITGGAGADQLYGNDVANTILGNQGSDDILGVGGNDILYGGQGSDVLQGGPGNDDLRGEGGNDIFLAEATIDGRDTFFGGAGTDKVAYDSRSSSVTLTAGNQLTDDGEAGEQDYIDGDIENLIGGQGADLLVGTAGANFLNGGNGDDELFGGDGDDELVGGSGGDDLDGGAGVDQFFGGPGNDTFINDDGIAETVDCGQGNLDDPQPSSNDTFIGCELL